jgi:hypothetical protein
MTSQLLKGDTKMKDLCNYKKITLTQLLQRTSHAKELPESKKYMKSINPYHYCQAKQWPGVNHML